ncbi:ATP-dependent helicase fft2 [Lachnellula suecica]|uniref:DNA helicase n=1 Tax=Lachnellula suecica TaxID=602035 RepID=A0A8T9CII1_9HELO|nr:ATP-dependent helicase fft2 [Lachnellula suecica]
MAFNFAGAQSVALVPDSPSVKRQKTASGYNSTANNSPAETGAYNSENDDGDDLFKDYVPDTPKAGGNAFQTQPTQILPAKATNGFQTQPTQTPPAAFQTQPTQIVSLGRQNGFETQPTQVLSPRGNGFQTQPTQMLPARPNGYETQPTQTFRDFGTNGFETQPTQILDKPSSPAISSPATPSRHIQVPASSPFAAQASPIRNGGVYPTMGKQHGSPASPSGRRSGYFPDPKQQGQYAQNSFTRNVATSMAPAGTAYRPPHGIVPKQSPAKSFTIDLTDDGPKFQGGSSDSDDGGMSRGNIKPSTFTSKSAQNSFNGASTINGNAKFQQAIRNSAYQGPAQGMQTRPDRARPVQDIPIDSLSDAAIRENVIRIRRVLPHIAMLAAKNALIVSHGSLDEAILLLGGEDLQDEVIELSDDDLQTAMPAKDEPQMKRGLNAPTVSIRDKYSSTQALPARKLSQAATPQAKPKRKLMQGRRNPSSPAVPIASSPLKPQGSPLASVHDDFDSDDSGVAPESEEDPELEDRVLKYLNTCKLEELIELTNTTKDNAESMINARPFRNLDIARTVENSGKVLKSGKRGKRAAIGDKLVDTAMDMFSGYEAIDALCALCEELGKAPAEEMAKWGFDVFGASKGGELEMTSLEDDAESMRDSGIGSPSSGSASPKAVGDDDIKIAAVKRKRSNVNFLKKPDLMAESCVLKDYQVVGLNWLDLMYRKKLSCILADEMGLGKTCQVIAFISHLVEIGNNGPHLVVCPGSTLENWLRECKNFAPQLVVEPYHGAQKERGEMADSILENRDQINIIVTTYDMAAKKEDNKFMRRLKPDVCVYDEGHYLKNPNSQRYQGLIKIPAKFKLLLTGTPLQNNLQELAALLGFIMPSVFEERAENLNYIFKAKATTRDADHAALLSAQRISRAKTMLTPFILRRKKDQVLKHLPTKTCRVQYATLHPAQKKVYDAHIEQARERAKARVEGTKVPKSDENNPLMQLRKAAIHPMLFRRHFTDQKIQKMADILRKKEPVKFPTDKNHKREHLVQEMQNGSDYWLHGWCIEYPCIRSFDVPDLAWMNSGKVEAMVELVKGYKENGDRVLIFSQFALVLDILQSVLNTSQISYTRIDGSTKIDERQDLIDIFRDNEDITAFLLTTKAGGTGINLMYANKVIIFDGSFNPQDDRQAENRAHRVGQTRDVEVVRLVTKGTIEEQIYALGQSKLTLDGRVAGDDDAAANEAGEKAVARMLLEGVTAADDEPKVEDEDEKKAEIKAETVTKGKETDLPKRKKSSILDTLVTKKESDDEGNEMLV